MQYETHLQRISKLTSTALDDGYISEEEFQAVFNILKDEDTCLI